MEPLLTEAEQAAVDVVRRGQAWHFDPASREVRLGMVLWALQDAGVPVGQNYYAPNGGSIWAEWPPDPNEDELEACEEA